MVTEKQGDEFMRHCADSTDFLERALEWIRDNMDPEELYGDHEMEMWAKANGYKKENWR